MLKSLTQSGQTVKQVIGWTLKTYWTKPKTGVLTISMYTSEFDRSIPLDKHYHIIFLRISYGHVCSLEL